MYYKDLSINKTPLFFNQAFEQYKLLNKCFFFIYVDREEEELFEEEEDADGSQREKPDEQEILDLLQMLLNFRDNDAGTGLHYATKVD